MHLSLCLGAINRSVAQESERVEKLKASDAAAAALTAKKETQNVKSAEMRTLENKKQRESNFQVQLKGEFRST